MNFCFHLSDGRVCAGRLWATGRYGFSLPKTVEILVSDGLVHTFLYPNRQLQGDAELTNRMIVRIAIAQFLRGDGAPATSVDVDPAVEPYPGEVKPCRPTQPRTPLRVRPGRPHAKRPPPADAG